MAISPSTNWQTVTVDPRTVTHGYCWINNGYGAGDPWSAGRPAFGAIDSFCFNMSDTNSGPYEVYIDNFANGATLIHDWEDAIPNASRRRPLRHFCQRRQHQPAAHRLDRPAGHEHRFHRHQLPPPSPIIPRCPAPIAST